MQMMGGRLREVHARIKELSTEEVEHRVAHILLRLVTQSARHTDDGVLVDFPITQQDLGEASGTTLHSVSRVLGAWEHTGPHHHRPPQDRGPSVEALSELAEGTPGEPPQSKTARAEEISACAVSTLIPRRGRNFRM
jgi:hypothetical protein